jgi:hypothetical protein
MKPNPKGDAADFFDSYIGGVQRQLPRSSTKPKLGSSSRSTLKGRFYSIKSSRAENRFVLKNYNSVENSHRHTPMMMDAQSQLLTSGLRSIPKDGPAHINL